MAPLRRLVPLLLACTPAATAQCALGWASLGTGITGGNDTVLAVLPLPNGHVLAARAGFSPTRLSWWDGNAWTAFANATNSSVNAMLRLGNGDLVFGGSFTTIGSTAAPFTANRLARWNGTTWSGIGGGIDLSIVSRIRAMVEMPNGDLVVGGYFSSAGGVACQHIARWNGISWSPLGAGVDANVHALAAMPNGDVIAGGNFLTAGGVAAANIARWNGSSWAPLGSGTSNLVAALAVLPDGRLVAGGTFVQAGGIVVNQIAAWDGASWAPLGTGVQGGGVNALLVLPNGDLIAGGNFTGAGGQAALRVARWNGAVWSAIGAGFGTTGLFDFSSVAALARLPNGELLAGGSFATAGGATVNHIARTTTSCPAMAIAYGSGCAGSVWPMVMAAGNMPVLGTTFTATTTGFAVGAVAIECIGTAPLQVPLSLLDPAGVPGCDLLLLPDLRFELALPAGGTLLTTAPVPSDTGLAGLTVHAQTLRLSLDAQAALRIESSNGLQLTLGTF